MSEFGHFGVIGENFCLDTWGAGPFVLEHNGKAWRFEDSDRFGPVWIRKDGVPSERQPTERSPFWRPYYAWRDQGRRVDGDRCVFELHPPRPHKVRMMGRHYLLFEEGDEGGGIEVVD